MFEEWAFVKDPVIVIPDESHSPKLLAETENAKQDGIKGIINI